MNHEELYKKAERGEKPSATEIKTSVETPLEPSALPGQPAPSMERPLFGSERIAFLDKLRQAKDTKERSRILDEAFLKEDISDGEYKNLNALISRKDAWKENIEQSPRTIIMDAIAKWKAKGNIAMVEALTKRLKNFKN